MHEENIFMLAGWVDGTWEGKDSHRHQWGVAGLPCWLHRVWGWEQGLGGRTTVERETRGKLWETLDDDAGELREQEIQEVRWEAKGIWSLKFLMSSTHKNKAYCGTPSPRCSIMFLANWYWSSVLAAHSSLVVYHGNRIIRKLCGHSHPGEESSGPIDQTCSFHSSPMPLNAFSCIKASFNAFSLTLLS